MSEFFYKKRAKNIFDPQSREPFKLSRTKLENFIRCQRCFYLDRRLGIDQPSIPEFTLNKAVDTLLKKEFDIHRARQTRHPLLQAYGIDAIPFQHDKIEEWRDTFRGVRYLHKPSNFFVYGAIDDVWVNPTGGLLVVDYKATSKNGEVSLEGFYQQSYKRQMEVYQWLLRQNQFQVLNTGYFVYVNGKTDRAAFDGKLEFDVTVIPYQGDDSWIEERLLAAKECLTKEELPESDPFCEYCSYRKAAQAAEVNYKS